MGVMKGDTRSLDYSSHMVHKCEWFDDACASKVFHNILI